MRSEAHVASLELSLLFGPFSDSFFGLQSATGDRGDYRGGEGDDAENDDHYLDRIEGMRRDAQQQRHSGGGGGGGGGSPTENAEVFDTAINRVADMLSGKLQELSPEQPVYETQLVDSTNRNRRRPPSAKMDALPREDTGTHCFALPVRMLHSQLTGFGLCSQVHPYG